MGKKGKGKKKAKKKVVAADVDLAAAAPALPAADGAEGSASGVAPSVLAASLGAMSVASGGGEAAASADGGASASSGAVDGAGGEAAQKALADALGIGFGRGRVSRHTAKVEAANRPHAFWDTQPVPSIRDEVVEHGPLEEKTAADVRQDPLPLPSAFEWCAVDITDAAQLAEVYKLLTENYVEDDDAMFRFDYSIEFLKWALSVPNYHMDWHVGVRQKTNGRLRGFITGIPAHVQVYQRAPVLMAEINFLCVHKKLRRLRLAPVLIKEITRRVNLKGGWQAVYTAGVVLPKPIASSRYWHRSINPIKLIEVGFSRLGRRMTP
jgi:glycylpeptide N-tetradecanoyltransferase